MITKRFHSGRFDLETNKIILGDSYSIIKDIPDNSIDLVIIDPPYNFGSVGGVFRRNEHI